ncbi:dihydrofolate reductase [Hoylesella saccharolytica]|uniref:dipeptidyl-peptidase 3 family protein n=1 Tax=Hoylesella saccharolytica TaxID=633701 RepID=UPI0028E86353|nr:dihydrofolate reductase [Hoylesella saccharolytica]
MKDTFAYSEEKFADIQMLRYKLPGFEELPLQKKIFIYYLSQATLCGRDVTTDQFGKYNLRIRKTLEALYLYFDSASDKVEVEKLIVYLKRVWFSNGIYHHYGCEKLIPEFSETFFRRALRSVPAQYLPMEGYSSVDELCDELCPVIFNSDLYAKRVNKSDGEDLVQTSACNYYDGVTQQEVEAFYNVRKQQSGSESPSWGLNSKLVKRNGQLEEIVWKADGMYGPAIEKIIYWLEKAKEVSENVQQKKVLDLLIAYYRTGDLELFDRYSIEWLNEHEGTVDFVNGFIEVYGDPLGLKASWEGIVEYKDWEATRRTQTISSNAQWFENHSPVDSRFKKENVRGVTANVVCAAMLGGDEYPSTAIGINLPNADWIRAKYGSKSVTIGNLTDAYNKAARNNGFKEEFVVDKTTLTLIEKYGDLCDDLHTDLHECLGHGSGKLLPGVNPDALKAYGNTIEEARADLFGLYYLADPKLVELGLTPDTEAYKAQYYSYMMNGLMTQLTRIELGKNIEEAHMRNRALIAHWVLERGGDAVKMVQRNGKTYVEINDYARLRDLFAQLLAEIQRIKSEGDFSAARKLVEQYAVKVDAALHSEVLERYRHLNLAPYKGFINPVLRPVTDETGVISDVTVDYTESYEAQMLRYSKEYGFLI